MSKATQYLNYTRSKYGDEFIFTFRKLEKLSIKLQKCKCDLEFLRLCIIYRLTPAFVRISLWKKRIKTTNKYKEFQHQCLLLEFKNRQADSIKYEKELKTLLDFTRSIMKNEDFNQLQKYLYERSKVLKEKTTVTHEKKLTKLNNGPVGQNYVSLKSKLVHNLSSHVLSLAEERILNRGWEFCIENKVMDSTNLKTDVESNMKKLETTCHLNTFRNNLS